MKSKYVFLSAVLFFICAAVVRADTIFFKYGTTLECKIEETTKDGVLVVLGNDSKGRITIDPLTIEKIQYDFDSRLEKLADDDFKGHYELGVWCEGQAENDGKMYDRALGRYLYSMGKQDVPDEVHLRLGRMFEKCSEPNLLEALAHYQMYLEAHPDSKEAAEAVNRLSKTDPEKMKPEIKILSDDEGLEKQTWRRERWGNPGNARSVLDTGNKRNSVLELSYSSRGKDKAAYSFQPQPPFNDLSKMKSLEFDVFNPQQDNMAIAIAIITGEKYEWFETKTIYVPKQKWSTGVRFDLTRNTWKSKASGWKHKVKPGNLNAARNIVLLVYNGRRSGKIYMDNIRFQPAE